MDEIKKILIKIISNKATYDEYKICMDCFISKGDFIKPYYMSDYFVDYFKNNNNYKKLLNNTKNKDTEEFMLIKVFEYCSMDKIAEYVVEVYNKPQNSYLIAHLFYNNYSFKELKHCNNKQFFIIYMRPNLSFLLYHISLIKFLIIFKGYFSVEEELMFVNRNKNIHPSDYDTFINLLSHPQAINRLKSNFFIQNINS